MKARILSWVVGRGHTSLAVAVMTTIGTANLWGPSNLWSQSPTGLQVDPQTGLVYQKVQRTIERPVVETKLESREQTVYTPKTVHETRPESRTVYTPIVEHVWQPRLSGRWNPFQQPTVTYQHVPQTRWEARNEVIHRTQSRTEWTAEKRKVDVPQQIVRMQREQKVEYEVVGRVAPPGQASPSATEALASRLRPLDDTTPVQSLGTTPGTQYAATPGFTQTRIAASTVGRMQSDPPRRSYSQGGIAPTNLYPSGSTTVRGQALPPNGGGVGIANLPTLPFFR